jgi:hypothetical protein
MESVGEKRNEYRCLFLCLVQYGIRGKCPSFCCKNYFMSLLKCGLLLTSSFNIVPLGVITCDRPGTVDTWITESDGIGFLLCWIALKCLTELVLESSLTCIQQKTKTFWSEWHWLWQWHRWCYSYKLHTVNWQIQTVNLLYLFSAGLQGFRVGHDKQSQSTLIHFPT